MKNCVLFVGKQRRLMRFSIYCLLNFFEYFNNYVNNIALERYSPLKNVQLI